MISQELRNQIVSDLLSGLTYIDTASLREVSVGTVNNIAKENKIKRKKGRPESFCPQRRFYLECVHSGLYIGEIAAIAHVSPQTVSAALALASKNGYNVPQITNGRTKKS